ncbi:g4287 [Coccomyxa elongata]
MTEAENAEASDPDKSTEPRNHGGPLKELSHLADGLDPGSFQVDDYEELEFGDGMDFLGAAELRTQLSQQLTANKDAARKRYERLLARMNTPHRILTRDKAAFVLGTLGAMLSAFWLGKSPGTFKQLYTVAAFILFALRFFTYRSRGMHYYLLDYCYVVHATLLVHLWVFPHSAFLHKITFAYASGPLAWSILAFRNSLVFHSLDKITSLFLHWFPACVAWTERWHPEVQAREAGKSPEAVNKWQNATLVQLVLLPCVPYLLWAVLYYTKVFIVSSKKIQDRNYETLFKWITKQKGNIIARVVLSVPPPWQPLAYMCVHITLTTMTFALCKVWWSSYAAHTAFLLFILAVSAWNGASYYFDYFSKHYFAGLGARSKSE